MIVLIKTYKILLFLVYYIYKLIQANLVIAYDILTPVSRTNPGMVEISIRANTDLGILLFSNLLSMTPGTLTIDYNRDKKILLVHYLYGKDKESILEDLEMIQEKVIEITNKK